MVYVNNSVGLTLHQSSVCEWDRHKMEVNKQEQRSSIKIAVLRGRNARQCHAELREALGVHVQRWVQTS